MNGVEGRLADILSRNWWVLLLRGLAAIAFGILTWLQPGISLAALVQVALVQASAAESFSPERFGIGAYLGQADSLSPIKVLQCVPGGPADRAGLLPGDVLTELDSLIVRDWRLERVLDLLLIDEPRPVRVTLLRDSVELSVVIFRERISDIAAGEGLKYVLDPDSKSYRPVPLHEIDPWRVGQSPRPVDVLARDCTPASLEFPNNHPALLYFWASWCSPCKDLIAKLKAARVPLESSPAPELIGINLDSDCETFAEWVSRLSPPGEQYWGGGPRGQLAQLARVYRRGIPTGVLLDGAGRIWRITTGRDSLLAALKELDERQ